MTSEHTCAVCGFAFMRERSSDPPLCSFYCLRVWTDIANWMENR